MPPLSARRPRTRHPRAELAISSYLAHTDEYAAVLARTAAREAAEFLAGGVPGSGIGTDWAQLKSDETAACLRAYRARLRELAKDGAYDGSTELTRLRRDGTWEPLRLPGDGP